MPKLRPILLAEDNANDVELVTTALKDARIANEIIVARDGAEALDFLHRRGAHANRTTGQPAVILLDLKMPKVDGAEVLRQIRATAHLKEIPVVMLTSSREESDVLQSYELGVNAYVVKPVDFEEFTSAVAKLGCFWALLNELPPEKVAKA
jgi:CheY-like chemotaxis protein